MGAYGPRDVVWMGLEVRDALLYASYREAIAPLLARSDGRFDHDFEVARVVRSHAGERVNRVFALSFPDAAARARFFADPAYLALRARLFEPAVASAGPLGP